MTATMQRSELERIGAHLYGQTWKSRLAEALEINRKTISRWIADDNVPDWAAIKLRALAFIAPPPGTTDKQDRDEACELALEPDLMRLISLAEAAGWQRGEAITALLSLVINDAMLRAGPDETLKLLDQARGWALENLPRR